MSLNELPGAELILPGLDDLHQGCTTSSIQSGRFVTLPSSSHDRSGARDELGCSEAIGARTS